MDDVLARARAEALGRYRSLQGLAALDLDGAARLAAFVAGARYAAVHLIDDQHQHRVASAGGVPLGTTPITDSMCVRVVESGSRISVPDATQDRRFQGNVHTSGAQPVRFYSATPLRDPAGLVLGTLCVFDTDRLELDPKRLALLEDIAGQVRQHVELHALSQELEHSALHDPLTGLANRRLLSDRLSRAMSRRARHGGEPALAMIDLDSFKPVNDEHGHQVGDALLVQIGRRLRAAVRDEDVVARLGGDEFVVLYEQLPVGDRHTIADALRARLLAAFDRDFEVEGRRLRVGASIGLAVARDGELGYGLLGRADERMYQVKAQSLGDRA